MSNVAATSTQAVPQTPTQAAPSEKTEAPKPDERTLKERKLAIRNRSEPAKAATAASVPAPIHSVSPGGGKVVAEGNAQAEARAGEVLQNAVPGGAGAPDDKPQDERVARAFRQIQQRDAELQKNRKAFEDEKKAHAQALADAQALREQTELYKRDPVEWLKKHGGDDAYKRLTDWRLGGDKQPVEEQVKAALERAAAAEKAIEEERAARAKEREELEAAQRKAASDAQLAAYKHGFAEHFSPQDRATAKLFGIADLEQSAVDWASQEYVPTLRANGVDGEALENELTQAKIAVKVKEIIEKQLTDLRANELLQGIFGGAAKTEKAAPQPAPKTGTKPAQALSLNNTMSATTDVGLGELSLAERKRIVHQRSRRR